MKKPCSRCKGRGKNVHKTGKMDGPTGPWKKCKKCKGKGYIRDKEKT